MVCSRVADVAGEGSRVNANSALLFVIHLSRRRKTRGIQSPQAQNPMAMATMILLQLHMALDFRIPARNQPSIRALPLSRRSPAISRFHPH